MVAADLGQALRRWRDAVQPEAAGLPVGGHRRAAGLRREELAMLAGISVDYVTRLEQGRASNPSAQVVEALARALRLVPDERERLFWLAGLAPSGPDTVPTHITPSVQRLLDRLAGTPVAVHDAVGTLLVANPPYSALMGDVSGWRGGQRNGVWRHFLGTPTPVRHTAESLRAFEAALVGDLRRASEHYPADQRVRRLIATLLTNSQRFAALWDSGVSGRHESARKTILNPTVGPLTLDCDVLTVLGSDLRIMIYTAEPGTDEAERLALLTVVGTQALVG
ncbi:helix-turn-helix transcriptional regulator [Cellulomonas hominis]